MFWDLWLRGIRIFRHASYIYLHIWAVLLSSGLSEMCCDLTDAEREWMESPLIRAQLMCFGLHKFFWSSNEPLLILSFNTSLSLHTFYVLSCFMFTQFLSPLPLPFSVTLILIRLNMSSLHRENEWIKQTFRLMSEKEMDWGKTSAFTGLNNKDRLHFGVFGRIINFFRPVWECFGLVDWMSLVCRMPPKNTRFKIRLYCTYTSLKIKYILFVIKKRPFVSFYYYYFLMSFCLFIFFPWWSEYWQGT